MQAVLDYRAAQTAVDTFNLPDKTQAFSILQRNPHLLRVLAWMRRAQDGRPLDSQQAVLLAEGAQVAAQYREAGMETPEGQSAMDRVQ